MVVEKSFMLIIDKELSAFPSRQISRRNKSSAQFSIKTINKKVNSITLASRMDYLGNLLFNSFIITAKRETGMSSWNSPLFCQAFCLQSAPPHDIVCRLFLAVTIYSFSLHLNLLPMTLCRYFILFLILQASKTFSTRATWNLLFWERILAAQTFRP